MAKIKITKGCKIDLPPIHIEIKVSIYNTGFYIYTNFNGIPDTTTRNTPEKVISYINAYLKKHDIASTDINWLGEHKVIQDSEGFYKTKI